MDKFLSVSAENSYPDNIKFNSIDWLFQENAKRTTRYEYGVLELLRDVGGVGALLGTVFGYLISF